MRFNGIAMKRGATLTYLHHDHLGSLVSATDVNGSEVASARYWPFGALRSSTGTLPTDRLFNGQTRDRGDDRLYFYNARYYDATIGKFLSPDFAKPKYEDGQALNAYAYVRNNPLRLRDPNGQQWEDWTNADWVQEFTDIHGYCPTSEDYAYRITSMALATGVANAEELAQYLGGVAANWVQEYGAEAKAWAKTGQIAGYFLTGEGEGLGAAFAELAGILRESKLVETAGLFLGGLADVRSLGRNEPGFILGWLKRQGLGGEASVGLFNSVRGFEGLASTLLVKRLGFVGGGVSIAQGATEFLAGYRDAGGNLATMNQQTVTRDALLVVAGITGIAALVATGPVWVPTLVGVSIAAGVAAEFMPR